MPILDSLASAVGGNIATGVADIIRLFKVDPNLALQHQAELEKIQADLQAKVLDAASAEVQAAAGNIQADAKSGDKFTARARPSFMYIVEVILLCNYIIFPLLNRSPLELPEPLFWLFGSAVLGYTGARSWEKFNSSGK